MTKDEKIFLEFFCKYYLISRLDKRNRQYKDVKKFIISELSYQDSVLLVFNPKKFFILKEGRSNVIPESELEAQRELKQLERIVRPYVSFGFSVAVGGPLMGKMTRAATGLVRSAAAKKWVGLATSFYGGALLYGGIGFGISLLFKLIKYFVLKYTSPCYKACKLRNPPVNKISKLQLKICTTECRLEAYNKVIRKMQTDRNRCNQTGNANRCLSGLNRGISIYQEKAANEQDKLNKLRQKLQDLLRTQQEKVAEKQQKNRTGETNARL